MEQERERERTVKVILSKRLAHRRPSVRRGREGNSEWKDAV